jgi:hypothetical protein
MLDIGRSRLRGRQQGIAVGIGAALSWTFHVRSDALVRARVS